jgi:hypothetical protein
MSLRRKFSNLLEHYVNPFFTMPLQPAPQNDALPAAKKPRLEKFPSMSTSATGADTVIDAQTSETVTTSSPDDTGTASVAPTEVVTVPASLPRAGASLLRAPHRKWTEKEDAMLIEAEKSSAKIGSQWLRCFRAEQMHSVDKDGSSM